MDRPAASSRIRNASPPAGTAPVHAHRIPRPPIPKLPLSLRQRIAGRRSLFFIGLMLFRAGWVVLDTIRRVRDPWQAMLGGAIFVMAVVIASPDRRLRVPAVGVMCALIWSYALAGSDSLDTPSLTGWPILALVALLAVAVELAYSVVVRLMRASGDHAPHGAAGMAWAVVALQTLGAWLFVTPIAFMVLLNLVLHGLGGHTVWDLVPLTLSLPPVVGTGIYLIFVVRRLRHLDDAHADL